jgi:plasmid stability protein
MSNMTLRGLDEKTAAALKDKARQEGTSVNTLTLHLLRQSLGLEKRRRSTIHTDLDHLAGTWNAAEAEEFTQSTAPFEKVDEDLWR